jgi:hypothetical protein
MPQKSIFFISIEMFVQNNVLIINSMQVRLKKIGLNVQKCVVKVAKCKQVVFLTSIQNTNSLQLYQLPIEPKRQNVVYVYGK